VASSLARIHVVRVRILTKILGWLAVLLILRVLAAILANYPDYFPPNFDSLFLQGREATFTGAYRPAFYIHIGEDLGLTEAQVYHALSYFFDHRDEITALIAQEEQAHARFTQP